MNISGIVVVVRPENLDEAVHSLNALDGVEVHQTDQETGRIVVTQEAAAVSLEVDGIQRIKALPLVLMAEMVYHYFGEDQEILKGIPPELEGAGEEDMAGALAYLNR